MTEVAELSFFGEAEMGRFTLEEVITAFRRCLKGKRGTHEAQEFEWRYMPLCVQLWRKLNDGTYELSRFIAFIKTDPVLREIYASKFIDRVVDTLIYTELLPLLEQQFVTDNYSTRKDKGALYGVKRIYEMIRQESENYTRDCYVLKDDIKSFFMSMEKQRVIQNWEAFVSENYHDPKAEVIVETLRKIVMFRPELDCVRKGNPKNWDPMPKDKLLGNMGPGRGFPIGKIISQLSALMYLDTIDHLITYVWKIRNGHYMDDRVMVSRSLDKLLAAKQQIDRMHCDIGLRTHPKKTYLQHYSKGVLFGGAMILPGRIYLSNRVVGNCFRRLAQFNHKARTEPGYVEANAEEFQQTLNSYFGLMSHFSEFNTSRRLIREIASEWFRVMHVRIHRHNRRRCRVWVRPQYQSRQRIVQYQRQRMRMLLTME